MKIRNYLAFDLVLKFECKFQYKGQRKTKVTDDLFQINLIIFYYNFINLPTEMFSILFEQNVAIFNSKYYDLNSLMKNILSNFY